MEWHNPKTFIHRLLNTIGIRINGDNTWDIRIHNDHFYNRVLREGALGLGESYMDGWWDCPRLDQFFDRVLHSSLESKLQNSLRLKFKIALLRFLNPQTKEGSRDVGKNHYDLGNELFKAMLDKRLNYTCGYWRNADNLEEAQLNKLELTCQKLMLKPGMRLLDIGCGWGALAKYAAENFGVSVVGITISEQQYEYAKAQCAGLPVEIRLQDYRDVNDSFDRIVSLGMFEHVGHLNYRTYMEIAKQNLKDSGIFLLHTIGANTTSYIANEWIEKYIFPNGMLPSIAQIGKAYEGLLVMEDWHNFGADYDKTLMSWYANFNKHWPSLSSHYDDRFFRMWNYYLLSCAGAFRARDIQLWQIVFSKSGIAGGYQPPRPYFQVGQTASQKAGELLV